MKKELAKAINMTLNDLSKKNETCKAVCAVLANRQRNRPEPMALNRLRAEIRVYMATAQKPFSDLEFSDCVNELVKMGWGKIIKNRLGRPKKIEFIKPVTDFKKEMDFETVGEVTKVILPMSTTPKPLTTKFVIEVDGGKAVIEVQGDVERVMKRLRSIL